MHPIEFIKSLINKESPFSSHRAINLVWAFGSFGCYWFDHFIYKRIFTNADFIFIATMAGVSTIAAVAAKKVDNNDEASA